jgi:hypothetical protein
MLIVVLCDTKVGKKISLEKKRNPFNYGLTLVNGSPGEIDEMQCGRGLAGYLRIFIRTISIRVSLTLTISNS